MYYPLIANSNLSEVGSFKSRLVATLLFNKIIKEAPAVITMIIRANSAVTIGITYAIIISNTIITFHISQNISTFSISISIAFYSIILFQKI